MNSLHAELQQARAAVAEAELVQRPAERFVAAHHAALRVAALVLAARSTPVLAARCRRPRNAWQLVIVVAPELAEWAGFFAATEDKREAVRGGAVAIVSAREADDLVRDAQAFLEVVERALGRQLRSHSAPSAR